MAFKDYAGLIVSVAALTISAATAYYTTFSERLDVSAGLTDDFIGLGYGAGTLTGVTFESRLVLVNSGNRAVAITALRLRLHQVDRGLKDFKSCEREDIKPLHSVGMAPDGGLEPFVVKAMDVVIVPVRFQAKLAQPRQGPAIAVKGQANRFQPEPGDPDGNIRIFACLEADFAAPGEKLRQASWPLARSEGQSLGPDEGGAQGGPGAFADRRTVPLVNESRGIFRLWGGSE